MKPATVVRVVVGAAFVAFLAMEASARPGGGNSYSGGSSSRNSGTSSSGSSSTSSGSSSSRSSSSSSSYGRSTTSSGSPRWDPVGGPASLIGLGFVVLAVAWLYRAEAAQRSQMDLAVASPLAALLPSRRYEAQKLLLEHDPGFSLVLFEDFACTLYAESQRARHDPRALAGLAPYWTRTEMASLETRAPVGRPVRAVVVGGLTPEAAFEENGRICIEYSFETNLHIDLDSAPPMPVEAPGTLSSLLVKTGLATVPIEEPRAMTQYVKETWTFSRDVRAKTRPWTGVRKLGCPNCGAPLGTGGDARCEACGQTCGEGHFDWQVVSMAVNNVEERAKEPPSIM